jgi:hypothetical protein
VRKRDLTRTGCVEVLAVESKRTDLAGGGARGALETSLGQDALADSEGPGTAHQTAEKGLKRKSIKKNQKR